MSDSVRPHRWQPTRLLCPWDSPGKNTGVGCHFPGKNYNYTIELFWNLCQKSVDQIYVGQFVESSTDPYVYLYVILHYLDSVQFSRSVVSNSLRPHESQHTRPTCPSQEFTQTHAHRVSDAIQPSHPLSSPSPPVPDPSQHQGLFQ